MDEAALVIWDDRMLDHDPGPGHPECPERLEAIVAALRPIPFLTWETPAPATRGAVLRVHDAAHVDRVDAVRGRRHAFDADTHTSPGSVEAAYVAAGAAIRAVDAACEGHPSIALCRPPGHHAERDVPMGFCIFNNVAVAAAHARAMRGCGRVMIIDWDVHHGNGTQHTFEEDGDVLFMSSHRSPFYPGTGAAHEIGRGAGRGATVNVPLPAGTDDATIVTIYRTLIPSLAETFDPDLILVSAGFDMHDRDPLGGFEVTTTGFAALCDVLHGVARTHTDGRIALILEGGYDPVAMAESICACAEILAGRPLALPPLGPGDADRQLAPVRRAHDQAWPLRVE